MKRTPEPELMDDPAQVQAYAQADFDEASSLFLGLLHELLNGASPATAADLGCGPAGLTVDVAKALPQLQIDAIDAGPNMLRAATRLVHEQKLGDRIRLHHARLPEVDSLGPYPLIFSNSLLHHLPTARSLWQSISKLARNHCYVLIMDLQRPESENAAQALVDRYAADEPDVLRSDFYHSLCAAYTLEELHQQLAAEQLPLAVCTVSDRHVAVMGQLI